MSKIKFHPEPRMPTDITIEGEAIICATHAIPGYHWGITVITIFKPTKATRKRLEGWQQIAAAAPGTMFKIHTLDGPRGKRGDPHTSATPQTFHALSSHPRLDLLTLTVS